MHQNLAVILRQKSFYSIETWKVSKIRTRIIPYQVDPIKLTLYLATFKNVLRS